MYEYSILSHIFWFFFPSPFFDFVDVVVFCHRLYVQKFKRPSKYVLFFIASRQQRKTAWQRKIVCEFRFFVNERIFSRSFANHRAIEWTKQNEQQRVIEQDNEEWFDHFWIFEEKICYETSWYLQIKSNNCHAQPTGVEVRSHCSWHTNDASKHLSKWN